MQYQLKHINLPVKSILLSMEFYINKLGFNYIKHLHSKKVILSANGFDFFIEEHEFNIAHPRFHFGIETNLKGVYEWKKMIEENNIRKVVGPQPTGKSDVYITPDGLRHVFYISDPDGHIIEIYSHIGIDVGYIDPYWSQF